MAAEWGFLLDENIDRQVANYLGREGYRAALVVDVLGPGVGDRSAVLPYARTNDLVVVTKDVTDFAALDYDDHEGIVLVYDHRLSAFEIATALLDLVIAYDFRDDLRHTEVLDDWV